MSPVTTGKTLPPPPFPDAPNSSGRAVPGAGKLTSAHVLLPAALAVLGTVLFLVGNIPTQEIFELLAGCVGIGVSANLVLSGGRRIVEAFGAALGRGLADLADKR
ncbi:hypothetical protein M8Z33_02025 [Streptomyces sp. ZAF1911]|uniref:hypothetical protein n=1 Tax=unclassified Streptomyces TaxID=2593676 RepID=UPI00237C1A66|nr:hypothetical protein [Streptomyces sp. ZAF1911]MDD9375466.1 hypothetical protein [Streptomyces sp. ZAF1911]